jgi:phosphodiesterase/alkaline phosphatase D-like protein
LFRADRTWESSTEESPVVTGGNRFELQNLKPATTYYYRLFVQHDEGKSWDTKSGSFTTQPAN